MALLIVGFAIGVLGHLMQSNTVVLIGIVLVFVGTVVLPLVVFGNPY